MNASQLLACLSPLACCVLPFVVAAGEAPALSITRSNAGLELSWPATIRQADGSQVRPYFELQRSVDLQRWQPFGERLRAPTATPGEALRATLAPDGGL